MQFLFVNLHSWMGEITAYLLQVFVLIRRHLRTYLQARNDGIYTCCKPALRDLFHMKWQTRKSWTKSLSSHQLANSAPFTNNSRLIFTAEHTNDLKSKIISNAQHCSRVSRTVPLTWSRTVHEEFKITSVGQQTDNVCSSYHLQEIYHSCYTPVAGCDYACITHSSKTTDTSSASAVSSRCPTNKRNPSNLIFRSQRIQLEDVRMWRFQATGSKTSVTIAWM